MTTTDRPDIAGDSDGRREEVRMNTQPKPTMSASEAPGPTKSAQGDHAWWMSLNPT
jgi:hypothetical protein